MDPPPPPPALPGFRGFNAAASLKQRGADEQIAFADFGFRGFNAAASLKPEAPGRRLENASQGLPRF